MKEFVNKYLFITVSILILALTATISIGLFFMTFSGKLSTEHQDWGALGSYLSGTVGVVAASLAVVWLIKSVHLQKNELAHLKQELKGSSDEQKKQTFISALSALISSSRQAITEYQQDLIALNAGDKHFHPMLTDVDLRMAMDNEQRKVVFYETQLELYLKDQYVDPYKNKASEKVTSISFDDLDRIPF